MTRDRRELVSRHKLDNRSTLSDPWLSIFTIVVAPLTLCSLMLKKNVIHTRMFHNDMNIDYTCNDKMNSINYNDISDDAWFTFELSRDVRRI